MSRRWRGCGRREQFENAVLDAWGLQWGKDKSQLATRQQTIYLSFDGEAERARVMGDLVVDRGG